MMRIKVPYQATLGVCRNMLVHDGAPPVFAVTAGAAMEVCTRLGIFDRKQLDVRAVAPLAVSYVGYIALSNLSLQLNSVAFYTIAKVR